MKQCNKCGRSLPLEAFADRWKNGKNVGQAWCKECYSAYARRNYETNGERIRTTAANTLQLRRNGKRLWSDEKGRAMYAAVAQPGYVLLKPPVNACSRLTLLHECGHVITPRFDAWDRAVAHCPCQNPSGLKPGRPTWVYLAVGPQGHVKIGVTQHSDPQCRFPKSVCRLLGAWLYPDAEVAKEVEADLLRHYRQALEAAKIFGRYGGRTEILGTDPALIEQVLAAFTLKSNTRHNVGTSRQSNLHPWRGGRVAMQRTAKPRKSVIFRPPPPLQTW